MRELLERIEDIVEGKGLDAFVDLKELARELRQDLAVEIVDMTTSGKLYPWESDSLKPNGKQWVDGKDPEKVYDVSFSAAKSVEGDIHLSWTRVLSKLCDLYPSALKDKDRIMKSAKSRDAMKIKEMFAKELAKEIRNAKEDASNLVQWIYDQARDWAVENRTIEVNGKEIDDDEWDGDYPDIIIKSVQAKPGRGKPEHLTISLKISVAQDMASGW